MTKLLNQVALVTGASSGIGRGVVHEATRAAIPLGRLAEVDDIVPSYVFLATDAGRHYQSRCISPNGGDVFL